MKLYSDLAEYYYFIENKHRNIANDISLIKQMLPRNSKSSILDIGCGTGEHCALLAREGFVCTGVDKSPEMIRIARQRNGAGCKYKVMDMLAIDAMKAFDCAICMFGSFDYLLEQKDVDNTLSNFNRLLKPSGIAILEVWNAYPIHQIAARPLSLVSTTYVKETKIIRERGFKLIERTPRTVTEVFYRYHVFKDNQESIITDSHVQRSYYQKEIERYVTDNGFKILYRYASSMKDRFHRNSNKLVLVMEKE